MGRPSRGCRVPYARLEPITPAQARARAAIPGGLSATLITGAVRLDHPGMVAQRDFRIEARGRTETLLATAPGTAYDFSHVTLSGLERDGAGKPVKAWDVNRLALIKGSALRYAELSWANDGVWIEEGGRLIKSWVHSHTDYVNAAGVRQHPDAVQLMRGGWQVVTGNLFDGSAPALPLTAAGQPIEVTTRACRTSQTLMVNYEPPGLSGVITFTGNVLRDGAACHVNLCPGPGLDGHQWWQRVYEGRTLVAGLVMAGNTIEVASRYDPLRGPRELVERIIAEPTNVMRRPDATTGPWTTTTRLTWATADLRPEQPPPPART